MRPGARPSARARALRPGLAPWPRALARSRKLLAPPWAVTRLSRPKDLTLRPCRAVTFGGCSFPPAFTGHGRTKRAHSPGPPGAAVTCPAPAGIRHSGQHVAPFGLLVQRQKGQSGPAAGSAWPGGAPPTPGGGVALWIPGSLDGANVAGTGNQGRETNNLEVTKCRRGRSTHTSDSFLSLFFKCLQHPALPGGLPSQY